MTQDEVVAYLRQKYQPVAILLHGSRARGTARPNSDWDLCVFVDRPTGGGPEEYRGEALDVEIDQLPISDQALIDDGYLPPLAYAQAIYDPNGLGAELIARARAIFDRGFVITDRGRAERRGYLARLVRRLEGTLDDPAVFFYHLTHFYPRAIRYWFETRRRWSEPVYEAHRTIAEEDPEFLTLLTTLRTADSGGEKLAAAKQIVERLFPSTSSPST